MAAGYFPFPRPCSAGAYGTGSVQLDLVCWMKLDETDFTPVYKECIDDTIGDESLDAGGIVQDDQNNPHGSPLQQKAKKRIANPDMCPSSCTHTQFVTNMSIQITEQDPLLTSLRRRTALTSHLSVGVCIQPMRLRPMRPMYP